MGRRNSKDLGASLDSLIVGVLLGWLHQTRSRLLSEKALVHTFLRFSCSVLSMSR